MSSVSQADPSEGACIQDLKSYHEDLLGLCKLLARIMTAHGGLGVKPYPLNFYSREEGQMGI